MNGASNTLTQCIRRSLIAKWKKPGYDKLCCARCIQSRVCWAVESSRRIMLILCAGYELRGFDLHLPCTKGVTQSRCRSG